MDRSNRINAMVSTLVLMHKDAKVKKIISLFKVEMVHILQIIHSLQSSEEANLNIEERHKIQCACDQLKIITGVTHHTYFHEMEDLNITRAINREECHLRASSTGHALIHLRQCHVNSPSSRSRKLAVVETHRLQIHLRRRQANSPLSGSRGLAVVGVTRTRHRRGHASSVHTRTAVDASHFSPQNSIHFFSSSGAAAAAVRLKSVT
ncbi:hypothetical protein Ddye_027113 [Dipteronia dyeriana]|uniref:Uncharacterized protein n=1 Tax=Dipteronia dyeriana TaxID=168575 RepID=A0AAD9WR29_9ROSI|nr:hypothetical protein Ddye_027113 [Dipteronia dyeriana]